MANTARNGILAGGNWILDRTKIIDVYPAQDALANILAETSCNGGGPYNVLMDLARLRGAFPVVRQSGSWATTRQGNISGRIASRIASTPANCTSSGKRRPLMTT